MILVFHDFIKTIDRKRQGDEVKRDHIWSVCQFVRVKNSARMGKFLNQYHNFEIFSTSLLREWALCSG